VPHTLYVVLNPDHLAAPADRYTSTFWIRMLKYTPLPYLTTFLTGIVLGRLHPLLSHDQRRRFAMAAAGLVLLLVFIYRLAPHIPYILEHGGLLTPFFALLVLGLAGKHPLSRIFGWKPLVLVGNATYCLYLLHFNAFVEIQTHHWPQRLHVQAYEPWISYVAIIFFSLAVNRWIEMPAKNLVLKLFKDKKAEPLSRPAAL
jgi:peptidoglycan/LPS O-acetylase OafA/YrhL